MRPSRSDSKRKKTSSTSSSAVSCDVQGKGGGTPPGPLKDREAGLLGTNAESISPPIRVNAPLQSPQVIDLTDKQNVESEAKRRASRAKRYDLQRIARETLIEEGRTCGLLYPENFHKTAKCLYTAVRDVAIKRGRTNMRAHYSGLVICAKVYQCAPCAAKIQEIRRQEIQQAINWAYENGFKCIMVTLTFPHGMGDILSDLMERFARALERLRGGKAWSKRKLKMGFQGLIRSLEITHGVNNWHPHVHELWIVSSELDAVELEMDIIERWRDVCEKLKLLDLGDDYFERLKKVTAFNNHAVDVIDQVSGSDYLAKLDKAKGWGVDAELAKGSTKKGKRSGRSVFQILESIGSAQSLLKSENGLNGDQVDKLRKQIVVDKKLFIEFTEAFKGKAQIFWTAGLKKKVGVVLASDDEAAEREDLNESDLLALLPPEAWSYVRRSDARAELLDVAEIFGYDGVHAWFKARGISILK